MIVGFRSRECRVDCDPPCSQCLPFKEVDIMQLEESEETCIAIYSNSANIFKFILSIVLSMRSFRLTRLILWIVLVISVLSVFYMTVCCVFVLKNSRR